MIHIVTNHVNDQHSESGERRTHISSSCCTCHIVETERQAPLKARTIYLYSTTSVEGSPSTESEMYAPKQSNHKPIRQHNNSSTRLCCPPESCSHIWLNIQLTLTLDASRSKHFRPTRLVNIW